MCSLETCLGRLVFDDAFNSYYSINIHGIPLKTKEAYVLELTFIQLFT